jgi:hypothetical protein
MITGSEEPMVSLLPEEIPTMKSAGITERHVRLRFSNSAMKFNEAA